MSMSEASRSNTAQVSFRLATSDDAHLPSFDYTKLTAINTCPTWGILRYAHHKAMPGAARSMALEAGSAAHDVFAAVRLLDLFENQGRNLPLFEYHGERLFGEARFTEMMENYVNAKEEDERTRIMAFALTALHNSGFYDDPRDKRRTTANIEEACIAYIDRWEWGKNPIWIRDSTDDKSDVGVEVPFDIVIGFDFGDVGGSYRFTGKMDGLQWRRGKLTVGENKTASRLDDAWSQSFLMSHQVTGYMLAASLWSETTVRNADIYGMAIPLPRSYDYGGIVRESVKRDEDAFAHWCTWFWHTVQLHDANVNNVIDAPRYTHSCNRYFRPCSFLPFCASPDEEKELIMSEMVHDEWSPLESKAGD